MNTENKEIDEFNEFDLPDHHAALSYSWLETAEERFYTSPEFANAAVAISQQHLRLAKYYATLPAAERQVKRALNIEFRLGDTVKMADEHKTYEIELIEGTRAVLRHNDTGEQEPTWTQEVIEQGDHSDWWWVDRLNVADDEPNQRVEGSKAPDSDGFLPLSAHWFKGGYESGMADGWTFRVVRTPPGITP